MRRMIVDMSSLIWTGLLAGKDEDQGVKVAFNDKEVLVNSAGFGYENAMASLVAGMAQLGVTPSQVILVMEGANSKLLRQGILAGYKDTRATRPPESYEQFNICKEMVAQAMLDVGASVVTQDGIEADDVIAYLVQNLEGERYIFSRDGDLLQLVGGDVHMLRAGEIDENTYGPFPFKHIRLYKALVGKKDEVPGAYRFGEKSFLDLVCLFGNDGLDALAKLLDQKRIAELAEDVCELKSLQRIIDSENQVYASWAAAKLYPEMVNTMRKPLAWRVGMVKPLTPKTDERLKPLAGRARLVHAGNYEAAMAWAAPLIKSSPHVSLDIETSTPPESDEWLAAKSGVDPLDGAVDLGVDVFGSFLVSMSLTFGDNGQFTLYFTHKHRETDTVKNLSSEQLRKAVELIPKDIPTIIQNVSFEYTVLYQEWGQHWKDNGWHGFIPNGWDTALMSNYVDENRKRGLKENSKLLLNYDQQTFEETTLLTGPKGTLPKGGKLHSTWRSDGTDAPHDMEKRRYKMDDLTAEHVFHYGCDDTICTTALYQHYRQMMEIEKTWDTFLEVEQLPAYLTALAYVQGVPISLERMRELELEDNIKFDKAWAVVRQFLLDNKWEGTVCPEWLSDAEFDAHYPDETVRAPLKQSKTDGKRSHIPYRSIACPAHIKEGVALWSGKDLETSARKPGVIAQAIEDQIPDSAALAYTVWAQDGKNFTALIKSRFDGEPKLDIDSPKKMNRLLYDVIGIPPRLFNKATDSEREKNPLMAKALAKWNKIANGSSSATMTDEEVALIKPKAKTDAFALKWALKFDATLEQAEVLNAIQTMATVSTRRDLYYEPYQYVRHWKDGLVHANANQCEAVTRRYSFSGPNWQQLPKKGDGIKFREIVLPHVKGGLVGSVDFVGQELRLMAGQSGDVNMLACYVGANLKDIHSITAAGAMEKKWSVEKRQGYEGAFGYDLDRNSSDYGYNLFVRLRKSEDPAVHKDADDLRKDAKGVNFAAQFDAQAKKLSEMLTIPLNEAQSFLDAKYAMFPGVETWKDEVRQRLMSNGYVTTLMGARRHLAASVTHPDKWIAERAGRQGPNFMIQGSAAEMTKLALARLWKSGVFIDPEVRFYFPVHDEIVWSASSGRMLEVTRVVNECMAQPYSTLQVPILGSISVGRTFGKQVEAGDWFVAEKVEKAMAKALAG